VVENAANVGFAKANNIGIRKASGMYVLLLNSDTEVPPGAIGHMVRVMEEDPTVGVSTCRLLLPSGRMDPACHRGFPTPWAAFTYFSGLEKFFPTSAVFARYHLGYRKLNIPHEIDCPSGAFFLVRRAVITQVGLLDEDYFMYGEDIDWAYRIKHNGWRILFDPRVSVVHLKKQSGRDNRNKSLRVDTQRHFFETMKLFYRKHYRQNYPFFMTAGIDLVLSVRLFILRRLGI
jgi:GT2 family glycosyltransferase